MSALTELRSSAPIVRERSAARFSVPRSVFAINLFIERTIARFAKNRMAKAMTITVVMRSGAPANQLPNSSKALFTSAQLPAPPSVDIPVHLERNARESALKSMVRVSERAPCPTFRSALMRIGRSDSAL